MAVDEQILSSKYEVESILLQQEKSKLIYLFNCLKLFWKIVSSSQAKIVAIWFADYHAAIAVFAAIIRGKESLIFIGGYDAVKYPMLQMGVHSKRLRGAFSAFALRHCNLVIANHQALIDSNNLYYNPCGHPEGVMRLVPRLHTTCVVIPNAFKLRYLPKLNLPRESQIVTVANTPRLRDFYNKGLDLLAEVARKNPGWKFIFIGIREQFLPELNKKHLLHQISNLQIIPWLQQEDLFKLLERTKVYAQPSISEGMPNALMEAMLCGCTPVGSDVAGIPLLMKDWGFVVKQRKVETLMEAIKLALACECRANEIAASIRERFSYENREIKLLSEIEKII